MSAPRLQDVLEAHSVDGYNCRCGQRFDTHALLAAHQAAVWRDTCTVRTVEQLDALPAGAVVREGHSVFERHYRDRDDGTSIWLMPGHDLSVDGEDVPMPALLVWHPCWEAS